MTIASSARQLLDSLRTDGRFTPSHDSRHLSGRVTDVAFRGRGYEHVIDVDGTTWLSGVFADVRAKRGEIVGLRMDPVGCHLFPVEHQEI